MTDRICRMFEILSANKTMRISLLAELLDVSQATLRKDLDSLEKRGIVCRTHGHVSLDGADDTGKRMAICHLIKKRIAQAAVRTVEEGETIMLESGSCCALFAEELTMAKKNVTIITNSVFIANYAGRLPNAKIILSGGYFQPESQVLVGPMAVKSAETFHLDKFFLGTDGFVPKYGFTGRDHLRVETALELAKRVKKVFILTESAKFHRRGAFNSVQLDMLAGVFTNDDIPKDIEAAMISSNVKLHKVPSNEEAIRWCRFPEQPPFLYTEKQKINVARPANLHLEKD